MSYTVSVTNPDGTTRIVYEPQPHQLEAHLSATPNLLCLGTRNTGKSVWLRWDAIVRCLMIPNFQAIILRRTMPELRRSHLNFIGGEMKQLGGVFLQTLSVAKFPNGSKITFAHCETAADVMKFLSGEYGFIGFDEVSTFTLEQFLQISAAARAPEGLGYQAVVRASSNTLGVGSAWMKAWFVDKKVNYEEYPDYNPDDFEMQFSTLKDNQYADQVEYAKRLKNLPDHVRRAWLLGEFIIEGAYFTNFRHLGADDLPWHVIDQLPLWKDGQGNYIPFIHLPWIAIYRAIDWGYSPDPAVCLWVAVLPDGHEVVFKEKSWKRTLAKDVARDIKAESEGMHIVDTFGDPSMFAKDGSADYSIAETFEMAGVPMQAGQNDRELFGYVICEHLDTEQTVEYRGAARNRPKMQILDGDGRGLGCPNLLRTMPTMTMDPNNVKKLAAGEDHWVVALAYFCMGRAMPTQNPQVSSVPYWMRPKKKQRFYGRVN